jgi:hypothetical protein
MWLLVKFLLAIVLTEATTEIVTKSEIFNPVRKRIFEKGQDNKFFNWLHSLLDCGYCFSVWAGASIAFLFFRDVGLINVYVDWFFVGIVLHRLSNLFHNVVDRIHGLDKL